MDEDRLTPQLGRLIDAAKAACAGGGAAAPAGAAARAEGWAVLGVDGKVYLGAKLAVALAAARDKGTAPEAAAFAVIGEQGDSLLPGGAWRDGAEAADPQLPVLVKYLGRWVMATIGEIPAG